ncbi:MAG: FAD-binding oxidoreductase, partial [Kiritimatiellia bacterium]
SEALRQKMPVTIQGGRTGINGGAVPQGGHILNLSRMNRILKFRAERDHERAYVTVQPGLSLAELRTALAKEVSGVSSGGHVAPSAIHVFGCWFLPPDPTEATATLGGMINCNASGALTFRYGSVRQYVERLRIVLADARVVELRRKEHFAQGRHFELTTVKGNIISGFLPDYVMPRVKNAAGLFACDDMDLLDLFIGSEGTLGVVTEIELRLVPAPSVIWAVMLFLPDETAVLELVQDLRQSGKHLVALEFFDGAAVALVRQQRLVNSSLAEKIPPLPDRSWPALYLEYHGNSEAEVEDEVRDLVSRLQKYDGSEGSSWIGTNAGEVAKLKEFRHAVPETVNLLVDEERKIEPGITKLGTDLAVPDAELGRVMAMYRRDLADLGLRSVIFGHIGDNHLHVNIIPRNSVEYRQGREIYFQWARSVVALQGTVSAEHGIGKLKRNLLVLLYGLEGVEAMKRVKVLFDPEWHLNRGNLFCAPP